MSGTELDPIANHPFIKDAHIDDASLLQLVGKFQTADWCLTLLARNFDQLARDTHARDRLRDTALPLFTDAKTGLFLHAMTQKQLTAEEVRFFARAWQERRFCFSEDPKTLVRDFKRAQPYLLAYNYIIVVFSLARSGILHNRDSVNSFFPELLSPESYDLLPVGLFNIGTFHMHPPTSIQGVLSALERMQHFVQQAIHPHTRQDVDTLDGALLTRTTLHVGANPELYITRLRQQRTAINAN